MTGVQVLADERIFLFSTMLTSNGTHLHPYPMCMGTFSLGVKWLEHGLTRNLYLYIKAILKL